jgi:hypothetical protein
MIVEKVDPLRNSFSDYSLDGNILIIGGVTVDLDAEEGDQEVIISFGSCNGMVHRDLMPCCTYVAEVIIPPRRYETVEMDGPASGISTGSGKGEQSDEVPATHMETVPVPLDVASVTLKLWPIVDESQGEINQQHQMVGGE